MEKELKFLLVLITYLDFQIKIYFYIFRYSVNNLEGFNNKSFAHSLLIEKCI